MSNTVRCALPTTGYIDFNFDTYLALVSSDRDELTVQEWVDCYREAEASPLIAGGITHPVIANNEGKVGLTSTIDSAITSTIQVTYRGTWVIGTAKTTGRFDVVLGNIVRSDRLDILDPNPLVNQRQILAEFNYRDKGAAIQEVVQGNLITGI